MLVIHRDGQLRVEIPKAVEDQGAEAVEAFVRAHHSHHTNYTHALVVRDAYRAELLAADLKELRIRAGKAGVAGAESLSIEEAVEALLPPEPVFAEPPAESQDDEESD